MKTKCLVFKGQFFTPQNVSDLMALMSFGSDYQETIDEKGYIPLCEPACGSGVMVTSICKSMKKSGLNYCDQLVVTAVDCDIKCVHMTFLQLSLYGIPAVVIHGDSLSVKEWDRWYTPIYLMNGWVWRESCSITEFCLDNELIKRASNPMYAAIRDIEGLYLSNGQNDGTEPPTYKEAAAEMTAENSLLKRGKADVGEGRSLRQVELFDLN